MSLSLKTGGLVAAAVLGATAIGLALWLARDPALLKRLVRRGAVSYLRAMELLAEAREQVGDTLAEAMQEAEDELRDAAPPPTPPAPEDGRSAAA